MGILASEGQRGSGPQTERNQVSKETTIWLNTQTLIGFAEKRGNAWHYRAEAQGDESNHYPLAIPVDDVLRRLFYWKGIEAPLYVGAPSLDPDFAGLDDYVIIPGRKAIIRSDSNEVLGIFSDGYQAHQYEDWLLGNVANILDADLGIGSAGLLRNGAQAWVSVEVPDSITTPEGVEFRPNLLACTSFDGSLATTYKRVVQNVVCDNTLAAGLSEGGQVIRVKHTRNSALKLQDARDALAVVHSISEDFAAEVAALCATDVSHAQWGKVLDELVPLPDDKGRSLTMATNKRDALYGLWNNDLRVSPWKGTAYGVLQAFNTYDHHLGTVRNMNRAQRNASRAVDGTQAKDDKLVLAAVGRVLATV